jgi:opacity protein-like surface antigen
MKKIMIAVLSMLFVGSVQAVDLGVAVMDSNHSKALPSFTVAEKWGKWGGQIGLDLNRTGQDWNRYSLTGSYDIFKLGRATFNARAGVAYIDNQYGRDGYSSLVGAGVSIPVTKSVSWTADWAHQRAQDVIRQHNGQEVRTGLKFSF